MTKCHQKSKTHTIKPHSGDSLVEVKYVFFNAIKPRSGDSLVVVA